MCCFDWHGLKPTVLPTLTSAHTAFLEHQGRFPKVIPQRICPQGYSLKVTPSLNVSYNRYVCIMSTYRLVVLLCVLPLVEASPSRSSNLLTFPLPFPVPPPKLYMSFRIDCALNAAVGYVPCTKPSSILMAFCTFSSSSSSSLSSGSSSTPNTVSSVTPVVSHTNNVPS